MSSIQTDIEARLAASEPDVEVLLAEIVGGSTLRLFIDHPDGVTLGLCERVTKALGDLRERYAMEVSSPGIEPPPASPMSRCCSPRSSEARRCVSSSTIPTA